MYKIFIKNGENLEDTLIVVDHEDEQEALKIFKKQVLYIKGIKKTDYIAKPFNA